MEASRSRRILVIGCSGSGKSTFSKKLHSILKLPLIHLDAHYHKPNWIEPKKEDWEKVLKILLKQKSWIMDGTYIESLDERIKRSDSIIYLDYSSIKCFFRVIKRVIIDFGKKRSDMASGCKEEFDLGFLKYVLTFNSKNRASIYSKIDKIKSIKNIIVMKNDKDVKCFLSQLQ